MRPAPAPMAAVMPGERVRGWVEAEAIELEPARSERVVVWEEVGEEVGEEVVVPEIKWDVDDMLLLRPKSSAVMLLITFELLIS
jgi:hypothetical protein